MVLKNDDENLQRKLEIVAVFGDKHTAAQALIRRLRRFSLKISKTSTDGITGINACGDAWLSWKQEYSVGWFVM